MTTARLICVTNNNNNKFYNMDLGADGSINIEYGRIGQSGKKVHYSVGKKKWDTLLNSKLKKGYQNVSQMVVDKVINNDLFSNIDEKEVIDLMKYLTDCSKQIIKKNYLVSLDSVTEVQLDEAQSIIDGLVKELMLNGNHNRFNDLLLNLYTTLPRKMKKVNDHLIHSLSSKVNVDSARKIIDEEQSLLSTLASQVNKVAPVSKTTSNNILDNMGVSMEIEKDPKMIGIVKKYLGKNIQYMKNIYKVTNHSTQKRFDDHVSKSKNKDTQLLWHGSRNENWVGILQQGLVVRPSNAIITGAMFGNGLYFANRAQKSLGYSSLRGSHWTGGSSNKGFLALFSVHTGNSVDIHKHTSSCYSLHNTMKGSKFDSVFAHKGIDLRNDEIMVYKTESATISYIIEMEK